MAEDWLDTQLDLSRKRIWVAGHRGMVGAATCRRLVQENCEILTAPREALDLRDSTATREWMRANKPDMVILAAAKVGGIGANAANNTNFLYDNLMIGANVIHAAYEAGVEKLLYLGSSCIYPREAAQPITEEALLSGPLEPTNEGYALAKIAGLTLAQFYNREKSVNFISAMPCNLYGPGDKYDAEGSHVIPALLMKAHEAKANGDNGLPVWGSGKPHREFLYVDDLADALVFLLKNYSGESHVNVGSGREVSIAELAGKIAGTVGFEGDIIFDSSRPDGTPRKVMDSRRIMERGWRPRKGLEEGLQEAYTDYQKRFLSQALSYGIY